MKIADVRLGKWYKIIGSDVIGQAATIYDDGDVFLRNENAGRSGGKWSNVLHLEETSAPSPALDLEQRVEALEDWRAWYTDVQNKNAVNINKRLCALEAAPAPDQPLKVGDEVWVRGKLKNSFTGPWYWEVDFGHDTNLWLHKDTEIKRA